MGVSSLSNSGRRVRRGASSFLSSFVAFRITSSKPRERAATMTEDEKDRAIKLWASGLSASQIEGRFRDPSITRNVVIGVISRARAKLGDVKVPWRTTGPPLRQPRKPKPPRVNRQAARPATPMQKLRLAPEPFHEADSEVFIPVAERKHVVDLDAGDCRWPLGDPREAAFHFCGRPKVVGLPYCTTHAHRAFAPPKPTSRQGKHTVTNVNRKQEVDA